MTLKRQPTANPSVSDRLQVEFSRLLCDDGHYASCGDGARKTQESWGVTAGVLAVWMLNRV